VQLFIVSSGDKILGKAVVESKILVGIDCNRF
jgi:hypothetical protein